MLFVLNLIEKRINNQFESRIYKALKFIYMFISIFRSNFRININK